METGEPSASGAGEGAPRCCHRFPPAGPDRPPRRRGAASGGGASPIPALPPASPPLLPSALRPPPAPGPRSAAGGPPGSGFSSPRRASGPPSRRSASFWRPWVDAIGYKEEGASQHAAGAVSERAPRAVPPRRAAEPPGLGMPCPRETHAPPAPRVRSRPPGALRKTPWVLMRRECPPEPPMHGSGRERGCSESRGSPFPASARNTRPLFPFLEGE